MLQFARHYYCIYARGKTNDANGHKPPFVNLSSHPECFTSSALDSHLTTMDPRARMGASLGKQ